MNSNEKNDLILRLNAKKANDKLYHSMLPEKYEDDLDFILEERRLGMRRINHIGYDVVWNKYFVYEDVVDIDRYGIERWRESRELFDAFEEYYDYLDGKIYENACYYQCDLKDAKREIDFERLPKRKSFIDYNIDNYSLSPSEEEMKAYKTGSKLHKNSKKWIEKFRSCASGKDLISIIRKYEGSSFRSSLVDVDWDEKSLYSNFMLWNYVYDAITDDGKFIALMEVMSNYTCAGSIVRELCLLFDPDRVVQEYRYGNGYLSGKKQEKRLKDFALAVKHGEFECFTRAFFDTKTQYYCEQKIFRLLNDKIAMDEGKGYYSIYRFFETFDDFIDYRHGDLCNTDLSGDLESNRDYTNYQKNKNTLFPPHEYENLQQIIKKRYEDGFFIVQQVWCDSNNIIIKQYEHSFEHFFDFVAYLKNDLSNANLVFCDGITNLHDVSNLILTDVALTSKAYEKFGISFEPVSIDRSKVKSFDIVRKNEGGSEAYLDFIRCTEDELLPIFRARDKERIHYLSDLHLMHKLQNRLAKTKTDILYIIKSIVDVIVSEIGDTLIIAGDVSSDYEIYSSFVRILRCELDRKRKRSNVIFVLGNHDLWSFSDRYFETIVEKYRVLLTQNGMFLLQNEIIYKDVDSNLIRITEEELQELSIERIRKRLCKARLIIFGGLAFSGFNQEFNANNGIYRETINRLEEQGETLKFCELYEKVVSALPDRKVIVATHMPMDCWKQHVDYHKGYIYVSGHTHKNFFHDDGDIRLYADNQSGYFNKLSHLKWFDVDNEYDCFSDYTDGIYKISSTDYQDFHRGKNIMISFNRTVFVLYMLKKNGYYCFIHESRNGNLCLLNGGAMKKLENKDINYYYDNMDRVISSIKTPLDKYTQIQKQVADEIRKIGGEGRIHGCIIDVDWFNHIYLNPLDLKLTAYSATDIVRKVVYPSVTSLLESECPSIYANYTRYIKENNKNSLAIVSKAAVGNFKKPKLYLDTGIYEASREIKKMQKLNSNILSTWHEPKGKDRRIEP